MEKREFEKNLLQRYLEKPEFEIRIRGKEELKVKVYYNGVKYFDYENGEFKLNKAVFLPNNKNRKKLKINKIPIKVQEAVQEIENLNFKFTVGGEIEGIQGKNIYLPYVVRKQTTETIKEELKAEIKKYFKNVIIKNGENGYLFEIEDENIIEFKNLYNLLLAGYEKCSSIKFYVDLIYKDILKIQDKASFDKVFTKLDEIMKSRINTYSGANKGDSDDYILTREDSEKSYQQKLMEIMNDKNRRKSLDEEIFKSKNAVSFEMEYVMYSKGKNNKYIEARIDNLAIKDNMLIMLELKMGTKVIAETNGIHKHLLDLCNIFEKDKNILNKVSNHINQRNQILKKYGIDKEYMINKGKTIILEGKEYYIICGYNEAKKGMTKKNVKDEIKRIYNKTIKDVSLFKTLQNSERSKLTENSPTVKEFHEKLDERYDKNLLNMKVPEYIEKLDNEYGCKVKIYLVNEDYTEFEAYKSK